MMMLTAASFCQVTTLRTLAEGGALHLLPDLAASPGGPPAYICGTDTATPGDTYASVATPPAEARTRSLVFTDSIRKLPRRRLVL